MSRNDKDIEKKLGHLVPGAVWESARGNRYTVIGLSNITVEMNERASVRQHELFPLSVVFLNEENDFFSCRADAFISAYEYVYLDTVVADYVKQLMLANNGELGPIKRAKIEKAQKKPEKKVEGATLAEQMLGSKYTLEFVPMVEGGRPLLTSNTLADALTSYSVTLDSTGSRFYKLIFATSRLVNLDTLNTTFNPDVYGDEENTYQKFILVSDAGLKDEIEWNTFCGISLEIQQHESFLAVTLANVVETETEAEPQVEEEPLDINEALRRTEQAIGATIENETADETVDVLAAEVAENETESEQEAEPETEQADPVVIDLPTEAPIELVTQGEEASQFVVNPQAQGSISATAKPEQVASVTVPHSTDTPVQVQPVADAAPDLDLDEQDLVTEDLPETAEVVRTTKTEVAADHDTPHTLNAQLASALAKQLLNK